MGEISFRETSGLEVVWGTFFAGTKGPFGGFLLPETDPLGPAGARVLIREDRPCAFIKEDNQRARPAGAARLRRRLRFRLRLCRRGR